MQLWMESVMGQYPDAWFGSELCIAPMYVRDSLSVSRGLRLLCKDLSDTIDISIRFLPHKNYLVPEYDLSEGVE